jgi:ankyrin repeat protein
MATTIFDLIDDGDLDGATALLARDPSAAATRDEQGLSALMRAAYRGGGEMLEAIRAAAPPLDGWDRIMVGETDGLPAPDAWSPDGFTPLHLAVFARNTGAARAVIAAGTDLNTISRASFAQVTPLGTAAAFSANEIAAVLLEAGADTEATADHGFTPLHAAASNGNGKLVQLLLAHGANREARNEQGKTPADLATNDETRALLT